MAIGPNDPKLTAVALQHVREGTTDLAPSVTFAAELGLDLASPTPPARTGVGA